VQFVSLDMVEEADRVAVRWQLSATYQGDPLSLASMAIYRFKDGRIAEDWGIPIRGEWLDETERPLPACIWRRLRWHKCEVPRRLLYFRY
jgi:hypothetical protein